MKKDTLRAVVTALIVLAIYHLVVFLIPFAKTPVFWISYGFSLAAFAVAAMSIYIAFCKNPDARSKFYGFPIARIGLIYGATQLVVSLVFMALGCWTPWWVAVLVYVIGLGAALLGLISVEAVVEHIQSQDMQQKKDVALMHSLQSKVNLMAAQCADPDAAAAVKALAEELRYADPVSCVALAQIEADLAAAVDELQAAVVDGDAAAIRQLCSGARALLGERNRLCKLNKN